MKDSDQQIIQILREIEALQGGGSTASWGAITGTLSNQTDLNTALGLKQTAAQVQALIDASLAGKGVIGTASFDSHSGTIGSLVNDGIIATVTYTNVGVYAIVFASDQPNVNYRVAITCGRTGGGTFLWSVSSEDRAVSGFTLNVFDFAGLPSDDARYIDISIMRLSQ